MRKLDRVLREILYELYESGRRFFKQKHLARVCDLSLGTINPLVKKLSQVGALDRKPQGFRVVDPERLLTYWSVTRDILEDIIYSTYVSARSRDLEAELLKDGIFTAFSGYRLQFRSTPVSYKEVYLYADPDEIRRMYRPRPDLDHNLFVLRSDEHLEDRATEVVAPLGQIYADLWQLGTPGKRFLSELEKELEKRATRGLEKVAGKLEQ